MEISFSLDPHSRFLSALCLATALAWTPVAAAQSPVNDTCATATALTLDGGPVMGSTSLAADDYSGSCSVGNGGRDVVFQLTLSSPADVVLQTLGSEFDTVLSVWSTCNGGMLETEIACNDDFNGITSRVDLPGLAAGTYYILLDGFDVLQSGGYVMEAVSPSAPLNDECDDAEFVNVGTTLVGSTLGAANDGEIPGHSSAGSDVFYFFQPSVSLVRVDTLGSDIDTVIAIREGACNGPILGSNNDFGGTPQSQVDLTGLSTAVTYYIQVDAPAGEAGIFQLNLTEIEPAPANDVCSDGMAAINIPSVQTGTTVFASDNNNSGAGPDVAFKVTVEQGASLELNTRGSGFDTLLSVRQGSCSGTEIGFNDDEVGRKTSKLTFDNLDAGDYFVFIDGETVADRGDYSLTVSSGIVPDNNTCETATMISVPSTQTGSTLFATDDAQSASPDCESTDNDVAYEFTLAAPTRLRIDTVGSDFDTVIYLRTGDCSSETQIACNDNYAMLGLLSRIDDFESTPLPAGDYRLYVDGSDEAGDYVLNVFTLDGVPDPDINGNGQAGPEDLLILIEQWQSGIISPATSADLRQDSVIDFLDLGVFIPEWYVGP
jgi:hypothetical protein